MSMWVIPSAPEALREAMIKYHDRCAKGAERDMAFMARTQKDKEFQRGYMNAHRTSADFWRSVQIGDLPPGFVPVRQTPLSPEEEADFHAMLGGRP